MTQALSKVDQLDYAKVKQVSSDYQINRDLLRNILGISESTQFRYEKKNPVLKPNIADRWSRCERVLQQSEELFVDKNETIRWLSTPKVALEGKTPLEALTNDAGSRQVEQILTRAEYGIFS